MSEEYFSLDSPENARMALIARIAEIFREFGYEGASLSRITEGSGLGKGSLYHFFPAGKSEMAAEVLLHIDRWFCQHIFQPLEQSAAQTGLDAMWRAVDDYFLSGRRVCLVGAFALDNTRDRFAAAINRYFTRWIQALQLALQHAGLNAAEANALAEEAVAGIQGALILSRALDDTAFFTRRLQYLRQRLATALSRRQPGAAR